MAPVIPGAVHAQCTVSTLHDLALTEHGLIFIAFDLIGSRLRLGPSFAIVVGVPDSAEDTAAALIVLAIEDSAVAHLGQLIVHVAGIGRHGGMGNRADYANTGPGSAIIRRTINYLTIYVIHVFVYDLNEVVVFKTQNVRVATVDICPGVGRCPRLTVFGESEGSTAPVLVNQASIQ